MKIMNIFKLALTSVLLFGFTTVSAQDAANDSADVWAVIEGEWNASERNDKKWPDRLLLDDFTGWSVDSPAPRSKSSTKMWNEFDAKVGKMVAHELYPLSIVVHDDVAVAHYLFTSAVESKDGDIETSNGRYTDVLVRTEKGWMFLSWHGGADE